jgi:anti-sigma-K factor RskA
MDHKRFEELKDAYVLGALTEEERREFEEYLAAYPERQVETDELAAVAGLLALSPAEQEPPAQLRRNLMRVVESEAESPRTESRLLARIRELMGARTLALGAAALLFAGLLSWNLILLDQTREMRDRIGDLQSARSDRMVSLEGSGPAQQARAEVMMLEDDSAVLIARDMPPVPENKTFQVWVIQNDVPKSGGLFEATDQPAVATVRGPIGRADAIAVTVEPEGGSPQPTSDPMLTAKL